jgi:hypothetical protein
MKFLPSDTFRIQTSEPVSVVVNRLSTEVEPEKLFDLNMFRKHKIFAGKVWDSGFKVSRIISGRNSFKPIITGKFEPISSGTIIDIKMSLHPLVIGFIGWILFSLFSPYLFLVLGLVVKMLSFFFPKDFSVEIADIDTLLKLALIPLVFILFIYLMTMFGFWFEARISKEKITKLIMGN